MWLEIDEFHARQPDAVGGHAPPAESGGRIGQVEHHLGLRLRDVVEVDVLDLEVGDALIDEALVALGAGHRDLLLGVQDMRGIAGADDGRQAQFAADDRRMRGAPAMVGDDAGGALHDRHPVRVGRGGDQDRAVDELVDVVRLLDQADPAGDDRIADRQARRQQLALATDVVGLAAATGRVRDCTVSGRA